MSLIFIACFVKAVRNVFNLKFVKLCNMLLNMPSFRFKLLLLLLYLISNERCPSAQNAYAANVVGNISTYLQPVA
jgi:hypothetical protein